MRNELYLPLKKGFKMSEARTARRGRGGGGAARRAERTSVKIETAKYIERNIPNFEILNEEALEIIEANAETILEEVGVNFVNNPAALERWKEAGATVVGERVHIPRGLARKLCSTAPKHSRNMPAIQSGPLKLAAATWFWRLFMVRPLCVI